MILLDLTVLATTRHVSCKCEVRCLLLVSIVYGFSWYEYYLVILGLALINGVNVIALYFLEKTNQFTHPYFQRDQIRSRLQIIELNWNHLVKCVLVSESKILFRFMFTLFVFSSYLAGWIHIFLEYNECGILFEFLCSVN